MKKTALPLIVLPALLAACGTTESDSVGGITLPSGPSEFREMTRDAFLLQQETLALAGTATLVQPSSSTVLSYDGHMYINEPSTTATVPFYLGEASATYDPSSSSLSGSANNFYATSIEFTSASTAEVSNGTSVSGTVTFSGSGFDGANIIETTYSGSVDGLTVAGSGAAGFYGTNGQYLDILSTDATLGGAGAFVDVYAKR